MTVKHLFLTYFPRKPNKNRPDKPKKIKPPRPPKKLKTSPKSQPDTETETDTDPDAQNQQQNMDDPNPTATKTNQKNKKNVDYLSDKTELIKTLIKTSGKSLRRIFRGIRFDDLELSIESRADDAAKAAIAYGATCAAVYNAIGFIRCFFTISIKNVHVGCSFEPGSPTVDAALTINFRPGTAVAAAFGMGGRVLFDFLKKRQAKKKNK